MKRTALLVALALSVVGCESERTIPTRTRPRGETINCVGITGKHKQPSIDYDVSLRNAILGFVGSEFFLIPPIVVLHHETFCPVSDTSTAKARA